MDDEKKVGSKQKEMPFLEHLEELRRVIIDSLIVIAIVSTACWFFSGRVIDLLVTPIGKAVFISPAEAFTVRLKLAFVLGALISLPFVFLRVWKFVVPGLLKREKSLFVPLVIFSTVLFYGGVAFSYFMLVPAIMKLLLAFGTPRLEPMISIDSYFSMVIQISVALGVVFQFPLVVGVLTGLGIITPSFLKVKWRYAVVIIFVVGAAVTPGDVMVSQLVVAVPLCGLYFLSILVSMFVNRRKERGTESEEDATDD
jgi:sec-independent protein translocase protein TatC